MTDANKHTLLCDKRQHVLLLYLSRIGQQYVLNSRSCENVEENMKLYSSLQWLLWRFGVDRKRSSTIGSMSSPAALVSLEVVTIILNRHVELIDKYTRHKWDINLSFCYHSHKKWFAFCARLSYKKDTKELTLFLICSFSVYLSGALLVYAVPDKGSCRNIGLLYLLHLYLLILLSVALGFVNFFRPL